MDHSIKSDLGKLFPDKNLHPLVLSNVMSIIIITINNNYEDFISRG